METIVILHEALWQLARLVLGERMDPDEIAAFLTDVQKSPDFRNLDSDVQKKITAAVAA